MSNSGSESGGSSVVGELKGPDGRKEVTIQLSSFRGTTFYNTLKAYDKDGDGAVTEQELTEMTRELAHTQKQATRWKLFFIVSTVVTAIFMVVMFGLVIAGVEYSKEFHSHAGTFEDTEGNVLGTNNMILDDDLSNLLNYDPMDFTDLDHVIVKIGQFSYIINVASVQTNGETVTIYSALPGQKLTIEETKIELHMEGEPPKIVEGSENQVAVQLLQADANCRSTIDDFSNGWIAVSEFDELIASTVPVAYYIIKTGLDENMIGTEREVCMTGSQADSAEATGNIKVNLNGAASLNSDFNIVADWVITWDGPDDDTSVVDVDGLGGLDFECKCSAIGGDSQIIVTVEDTDLCMFITMTLWSTDGSSSSLMMSGPHKIYPQSPKCYAIPTSGNVYFLFDSFVANDANGVDWNDIGAITLQINGGGDVPALDTVIDLTQIGCCNPDEPELAEATCFDNDDCTIDTCGDDFRCVHTNTCPECDVNYDDCIIQECVDDGGCKAPSAQTLCNATDVEWGVELISSTYQACTTDTADCTGCNAPETMCTLFEYQVTVGTDGQSCDDKGSQSLSHWGIGGVFCDSSDLNCAYADVNQEFTDSKVSFQCDPSTAGQGIKVDLGQGVGNTYNYKFELCGDVETCKGFCTVKGATRFAFPDCDVPICGDTNQVGENMNDVFSDASQAKATNKGSNHGNKDK